MGWLVHWCRTRRSRAQLVVCFLLAVLAAACGDEAARTTPCKAGTYGPGDGDCVPCDPGTHCPEGSLTPTSCIAGETWDDDATAATGCVAVSACAATEYESIAPTVTVDRHCTALTTCSVSEWESTAPTATSDRVCAFYTTCQPGEYISGAGTATTDRICTACTSGTFSASADATSCAAWTVCEVGTYVTNVPSATADRTCAPCSEGTFTSGPNQSACVELGECPAGTVQTTPGDETMPPTCAPCAVGEYCPGGDAPAASCGDGTWDHDADPSTVCVARTACLAGTYVSDEGDAENDRRCTACAVGFYSTATNEPSCTPWTVCVPGEYVGTNGTPVIDRGCTVCANGDYSTTTNALNCDPWTVCAAGQYISSTGSATSDRACAGCATGSFSDTQNVASCTPWTDCAPGEYVTVNGSVTENRGCGSCPDGTFSDAPNQASCLLGICPAGSVQTAPGTSTLPPTCTSCTTGEFCAGDTAPAVPCNAGDGTWDHDGDPASECMPRTDCVAGQFVLEEGDAVADRICAPCSAGSYSTAANAASCSAWAICAPGEYVLSPGTATSDRVCAACLAGFTEGENATSCTAWQTCVPGQRVSTEGTAASDRQCAGCVSGTFSTVTNATSCEIWQDCTTGTFVTNTPTATTDRECAACAPGTFTDGPNQSACLDQGTCSAGSVQTAPGTSTSPVSCATCSVGEYCAGGSDPVVLCATGWDHDADPSTPCAPRTACVAGERVIEEGDATTDRSCETCEAGTFTTATNAPQCYAWTSCAPGEFISTSGSVTNDRVCSPCMTGAYSSAPDAVSCTPWTVCGSGNVEATSGSSMTDRVCVPEWIRQFGTTSGDHAFAVAVDRDGDVLVAGYTSGVLPGTPGSVYGTDAFIRKYTSDGGVVWTRQFGFGGNQIARAVATDSAGNIFVAGQTSGALPGETSAGGTDAFVRMYSSDGTVIWTRQFGSTTNDYAFSVAVDSGSAVVVAGYAGSALPGGISAGSADAFVRKYDYSGTLLWSVQFGSATIDSAESVVVDGARNVIVAGYTYGALPGQVSAGNRDAFVCKFFSNGILSWTRQFGTSSDDFAQSVAVDAQGNAYVAGGTAGAFPGYFAAGGGDAFLRRYTSNGNPVWNVQFGTSAGDHASSVAVSGTGDVIVAGDTSGTFPGLSSAGERDMFVRRYGNDGVPHGTRQLGTTAVDTAHAVAVNANGDVIIGGETLGTFPGETWFGIDDAFVGILSSP
jgi:hypothetical protein